MDLTERKISSENIFNGKIIAVKKDKVRLPNGGTSFRECVEHNGGCAVVPITAEGKILLVKQFRYPYNEVIIEIPAGKLELGEDPLECAVRELKEEVGGVSDDFTDLGVVYPSPGYTNEIIKIYLAKNVECGDLCPDDDEFLEVESYDITEVKDMICHNIIKDGKTIIGVLRALLLLDK